jgi:hypothetical protein
MQEMPFLHDVIPTFGSVRDGLFQRNNEYRTVSAVIPRFLLEHTRWFEGSHYDEVTKLTWRLFEQWTFLRIVEAFGIIGLDLREWLDRDTGRILLAGVGM